jgi:purine-binding chemotaxis protein CheW
METVPLDALEGAGLRRACLFLLGGARFAVDVRQAQEIVVLDAVTRVPGGPAPLLGVTNVRGTVLAVADARPLLGLPPRGVTAGAQAVVLAEGDLRAAIPIDQILGLDWFGEPREPDEGARRAFGRLALGVLRRGDEPFTLLDGRAVLDALRRGWSQQGSS